MTKDIYKLHTCTACEPHCSYVHVAKLYGNIKVTTRYLLLCYYLYFYEVFLPDIMHVYISCCCTLIATFKYSLIKQSSNTGDHY